MKLNTYTVAAVCGCGCDQNEVYVVEALSAEKAAEIVSSKEWPRRIVAVFEGEHEEARKQ